MSGSIWLCPCNINYLTIYYALNSAIYLSIHLQAYTDSRSHSKLGVYSLNIFDYLEGSAFVNYFVLNILASAVSSFLMILET